MPVTGVRLRGVIKLFPFFSLVVTPNEAPKRAEKLKRLLFDFFGENLFGIWKTVVLSEFDAFFDEQPFSFFSSRRQKQINFRERRK